MPKTKRKLGRKRKTVKHRRRTRRMKKRSRKMRGGDKCSGEEEAIIVNVENLNLKSKKYVKKYNDLMDKCYPSQVKKKMPVYKREEREDCKNLNLNPYNDSSSGPYAYLNHIEKRADTLLETINEKDIQDIKEEFQTISDDFLYYTESLRIKSEEYQYLKKNADNYYPNIPKDIAITLRTLSKIYSNYLCFKPKFDDIEDTLKHIDLLIKKKECDSKENPGNYQFDAGICYQLYDDLPFSSVEEEDY